MSKTYYLRTNLGEFKKSFDSPDHVSDWIKENRDNQKVETLTGWECFIRPCDVKIWGELEGYMETVKKEGGADVSLSDVSGVKFYFSRENGHVFVIFLDQKGDEIGRLPYDGDEFSVKMVEELPNAILDAIIEEQERRAFS